MSYRRAEARPARIQLNRHLEAKRGLWLIDRREATSSRRLARARDRNYLKGRLGDRINAVLAAASYNFGPPQRRLAEFLARRYRRASRRPSRLKTSLEPDASLVLHGRLLTSVEIHNQNLD
jgi:hypothetical protein